MCYVSTLVLTHSPQQYNSGGGLDPVSGVIVGVVESVASFVFLHSVDERSVGLSVVGRGAVPAGDLVDGVRSEVRGRSDLRLGE